MCFFDLMLLPLNFTGIPEGYPRITIHPSLKAVEKDRNTVLQCGATGIPEPKITWLRDFIPVDLSNPRLTLLESGKWPFLFFSNLITMYTIPE